MTGRPTHREIETGAAVFPEGYLADDIELLPDGYWEEHDLADAWRCLRSERDRRLLATDWTQTVDQVEARRSAWQPYRQSLRDLPDTVSDPSDPDWPEEPVE